MDFVFRSLQPAVHTGMLLKANILIRCLSHELVATVLKSHANRFVSVKCCRSDGRLSKVRSDPSLLPEWTVAQVRIGFQNSSPMRFLDLDVSSHEVIFPRTELLLLARVCFSSHGVTCLRTESGCMSCPLTGGRGPGRPDLFVSRSWSFIRTVSTLSIRRDCLSEEVEVERTRSHCFAVLVLHVHSAQ